MSEWWTYRPSDFLMFSPRIYARLFEQVNAAWWPVALLVTVLGVAGLVWVARRPPPTVGLRAGALLLAAGWAVVAWAFLWQRFAPIQWVAGDYAVVFALQAAGLAGLAALGGVEGGSDPVRRRAALALGAWALAGHPLLGLALGRSWTQVELAGVAPDPTVLLTLAWLLLLRPRGAAAIWGVRALWAVPLAWCVVSAVTLWTLGSLQGWSLAGGAALALTAAWRGRRRA